jgi:hypothetical protein
MVPLSFTYPDLRCGRRYSGVAKCLSATGDSPPIEARQNPATHAQPRAGGHRDGRPSLLQLASQPAAQDVELRSFDGTVELEGNLIAYDGAYYQIDTIYGPLTVSAEGVSCAGPGCPDLTSFVAEAYIAGAATVAEGLLPDLLAAFGAQQDLDLTPREADGDTVIYTLVRPDDQPAARFFVTRAPRMRGSSRS